MNKKIKIGFIGYGNMAQAIANGLIKFNICDGNQILACAKHFDKLCNNAKKLGVHAVQSSKDIAENSDFIIIAVKPYLIESVILPIVDLLENKVVISIAAGYNFEKYEKILKPTTHHISTIPNTPVSVGEGILICENKHSLTEEEFSIFINIFNKIALIEMVDSEQLSISGTISGCAPAFTAMYLEALADAGVKHGLTRETSYRIAAKMISGTGKLYLESKVHPGIMKDAVCSPGGTTIKGVSSLEKNGFRGTIIEAIDTIQNN